jgi:hypothetical protein
MWQIRSFWNYQQFLFFFTLLTACQSQPIKDFEKVSLGQDKSDVIETIGGPSWKDRRQGFDRWTYIIYQDGIRLEKEIRFLDGIVAYKGEPIPPFISAEEQDAINAEKNLIADRMDRLRASAPPPIFTTTRTGDRSSNSASDSNSDENSR